MRFLHSSAWLAVLTLWLAVFRLNGQELPSQRPRSFYGINADPVWDFKATDSAQSEMAPFAKMLRRTRTGTVRIPLRWRVVEPSRGEWDFTAVDRALAAIPPGVEILAVLMSVPEWANGKTSGKVEGWFDSYPPRDLADWERAVAKIVARYRARIRHWEIWNEPNGVDFYRPKPDVQGYAELLRTAWRAAKKEDPQCVIVLGGLQMNGVIANPWSPVKVENFLEELYRAGAGPFFDVCNTHPYVLPSEGAEKMMALTRDTLAVMARHGDAEKPLWLTEVGCGAKTEEAEREQARLLEETFALAAGEPRLERVFWFTLRDLPRDLLGPEASMGLFRYPGGEAKPALKALVQATPRPTIDASPFDEAFAGKRGAFVLIDCATGAVQRHNPVGCGEKVAPCSTFKIWNSAIGLEMGLITDPDAPFWTWDGERRSITDWNADQTLRSAFAVSCVPAYQALARRIGREPMQTWIDRLGYGDRNTSAGLEIFWLPEPGRKPLLISPDEQAEMITRLVTGRLPFSEHTRATLASLMRFKQTPRGIFYGKTGSGIGDRPENDLGWFVGYVESGHRTLAFACLLRGPGLMGKDARTVVERILTEQGVL